MGKTSEAPVFDADQHYYEAVDSFTRYLPEGWAERTVQKAVIEGRVRFIVGGKINSAVSNPTFDPIVKAGAMVDYFRGNPENKTLKECLADREPLPDYYRDPAARIKKMDEQGVDYTWMLPTLGMAYEEDMQHDPQACAVAFHSFNEWLLDDWGFEHEGRIFSSPYLALGDVDAATREVEWMLDKGAKIIVVRPSGIYTEEGWRSPGDEMFDPVWARIREANVTVVPHVAESGGFGLERYMKHGTNIIGEGASPMQSAVGHERPISNYMSALICDRLFERLPGMRFASVENGADFLPGTLKGVHRAGFLVPGYFEKDPVETFKEHIWVAPFWEDDLAEAVELIGADRILFGSDYPHPEGMAEPLDYYNEMDELEDAGAERQIMYKNAAYLTGIA